MSIFDKFRKKDSVKSEMPERDKKLPIGLQEIRNAQSILNKYMQGKSNLDNRIISNEKWYRLRHWDCLRSGTDLRPYSAWLLNAIINKHADATDNYPAPNILPREEGDKNEAEMLSSIIPVILDENDFENTYSDAMYEKISSGTAAYGIFWDGTKHNGLGDIAIRNYSLLNLFWESGVKNIQDSPNFFNVQLVNNDFLLSQYPELKGKLNSTSAVNVKYITDENIDTANKSEVVDWYYKKRNAEGKTVLHFVKYVGNNILFATENQTEGQYDEYGRMIKKPMAETGLYEHCKYPFVFDAFYPIACSPCGFGLIDIGKSPQEFIDRGNAAMLENMLDGATSRYFLRSDGSINEDEFNNKQNKIIHVTGNLGEESIREYKSAPLSSIYLNIINDKIAELKETTGNRDVSSGGAPSGVTSGAAIAALQEAGSKTSRDLNKGSYRAYREIIYMVIELVRQFYDVPRSFRILGNTGIEKFVQYSNSAIAPQLQTDLEGQATGYRIPEFDIEVTAQKASPYSKLSQNELALQLYREGFFNPQMAEQALACLDMMDFDRKSFVLQSVITNQQNYIAMLAAQVPTNPIKPPASASDEGLGTAESTEEAPTVRKSKQRVAESTAPR